LGERDLEGRVRKNAKTYEITRDNILTILVFLSLLFPNTLGFKGAWGKGFEVNRAWEKGGKM